MQILIKGLHTMARDEALRRTQLDCLHGRLDAQAKIDARNPIYWAGFTLYGENKKFRPL